MYTFIKLYCTRQKAFMPWMLKCSSTAQLIEHEEKYMTTQIEKTVNDLFSKDDYSDNKLAEVCNIDAKAKGTIPLISCAGFEQKIFASKVKTLLKFGTLYLREIGSYTIPGEDFVISDTVESEQMVYPEYTPADIKLSQWINGTHWYAKIKNLTVEIDGKMKWDSKHEAITAANSFFEKL